MMIIENKTANPINEFKKSYQLYTFNGLLYPRYDILSKFF